MERIDEIISLIEAQEKKEAKSIFLKYLRKWPLFLLLCLAGGAIGFFYYKNSPNIYEVKSRILIKNEDNSLGSVFNLDNPMLNMGKRAGIENQLGILKSYTLFRKALDNLNWQTSWFRKELFYNADLYNNEPFELIVPPSAKNAENVFLTIVALDDKKYKIEAEGETTMNGYLQTIDFESEGRFGKPFYNDFFNFTLNRGKGEIDHTYLLRFNNLHWLTSHYMQKTQIDLEDFNSDLISIRIHGENIHKEADFINELNNVFIEFGMENKFHNSEKSMEFIDSQLSRIEQTLGSAEEEFSDFRRNNQVINLGQEAQLIYSKLEEIENEKYLTQLQIDYYTELQQYLDDSRKIGNMVNPSVIGIKDPDLSGMLSKLTELYSRREQLSYSVQDKNPSFIMLEKDIKITRDGLEESLKNQLRATKSKMESMQERYSEVQSRVRRLPETERNLISIQRDFDLNNELYTYMLQKKAEVSITKASIAPQVQIIDSAIVEAAIKVGPSLMKNFGAGIFAGITIPFIIITLMSFFNNSLETREEVEKWSTIPVLEGIIQHKYKEILPVIHHPRSGIAESFRGLKSNLNAILEQQGSRVISINSLIPGEGKSFISSNLSAILTKTNSTVLLIGADLHNPTLHEFLDIEKSFGLSNYLLDEIGVEEIISPTTIPNLNFIQAGPIPSNPSDLFDNDKFEYLIEKVRKLYDYIIIDNAPLLLVPDVILISKFADISLFVLRMNFSHKEQVRQINKIVDFNKIERAAIVINEAPDRGYGYGKKYWKKGYGEYRHKMSIAR
jgi:tyrosine-protein kinase Etk/Wzc